jgi:hypothetical protein
MANPSEPLEAAGLRLMRAFVRIPDADERQSVIALAEQLANQAKTAEAGKTKLSIVKRGDS